MRIALSMLGLLGLLGAGSLGAQVIYKWVDANGHPHYSDVPREGAIEVAVAAPQSFTPVLTARSDTANVSEPAVNDPEGASPYTNFAITSPQAEETIWNTGGNISVSLALQPKLSRGHMIRLLLNGREQQQLSPGSSRAQLSDVFRGTHQLQAQVVNAEGQVVTSSPTITFYYKQSTANRAAP